MKEKIEISEKNEEEKMKNIEELSNVKKKYTKIRNIIIILIFILILFGIIYYSWKYIVLSKILRANYSVNLGTNYKITEYINGNIENHTITYYKDGVCVTGTFWDENKSYFYLDDDNKYYIQERDGYKSYRKINVYENYDPEKIFLFNFQNLLSEPKEIQVKDVLNYTFKTNIIIGKEEYRGKEYITLQNGMEKLYSNPENYYIEKQLYQGQVNERIIEKGVVTTETELPDLSTYIDETSNL